jgi:GTPase SAR1 family protein
LKKTIFVGLDNSGKTSIIYTLQKQFSLINSIRPTLGSARSYINILGQNIATWDLGGQKKYRDRYFKEKYNFFSDVETMYYIIDMFDTDRHQESLKYLFEILKLYDDMDENPLVMICFHKIDPDKRKLKSCLDDVDSLKNEIEKNKYNLEVRYHKTSIHDDFTVIKAFSEGILHTSEKSKLITNLLKEYSKTTYSSCAILLDDNAFIIGAHYKKKKYLEICETVAPRLSMIIERLEDYSLTTNKIQVDINFREDESDEEERNAYIYVTEFTVGRRTRLCLVTLAKNEKTLKLSNKYLPEMSEKLLNLLESLRTN